MNCPCHPMEMKLAQASFLLDDAKLYLDTHPCDPRALEYYRQRQAVRQAVLAEYTEKVGPISAYDASTCGGEWSWVKTPWPWQMEG